MEVIRNLQISLGDQLDQAFNRAYNELNAELAARDARIHQAEEKARTAEEARVKAVKRAEKLRHENESFQKKFRADQTDTDGQSSSAAIFNDIQRAYDPEKVLTTISGGRINAGNAQLLEAHRSLQSKYRSLYTQVQELATASDTLRRKVKQAKKTLSHWQGYFNREEFTVPVQGVNVTFRRFEQTGERNYRGRSSSRRLPQPFDKRDGDQVDLSLLQSSDSTPTASQSSGIEEQKQRDESDGNPPAAMIVTPVEPNVTVEPVLPPLYSRETMATGTYERPAVIKAEKSTSSELDSLLNGLESGPPGTQDLEDIGKTVETPRKHVHWDNGSPGTSTLRVFHESEPRRFTFGRDSGEFRAQQTTGRQTPLQPIDTNRAVTRQPGPGPDPKRRKTGVRGVHAIPSVAEDGEENYAGMAAERNHRMANTPAPKGGLLAGSSASAKRRLDDLLAAPSPKRSPLLPPRSQKAPTGATGRLRPDRQRSPSRQYLNDDAHSPEPPDPEDEPFRCRPVHKLNLDCFKINTEYNQGLEFAFDEVVRKRDQRKCLAGCTRPDCCGDKFRAMARAGGLTSAGDEDSQILEDYMGDQKHKLETMGEQEKHDLLIEAKARLLANQYGKHRYAHERPRSPPGFWRTDMPSTQELERDQEDARKLEREKVMERYREAMRPGGLWKFADEP